MLKHPKIRAVGEIRLDYSSGEKDTYRGVDFKKVKKIQMKALRKHVLIARELELPIIIHVRDALADILEIFSTLVPNNYPIHRHCFMGT